MAFPIDVDALFTNPTSYDANEFRLGDAAFVAGAAGTPWGGVARHSDTSLTVTVNASDQVTIQPGSVIVPGNAVTGSGIYRFGLTTAQSETTAAPARNETNPRIDLIVARALDDDVVNTHDAYKGRFERLQGTAAAVPSAPALPSMAVELARITIPQVGGGAASIDSSYRTYATAAGGAMPVASFARLPASPPKWQRAVALDTGREYTYTGTAWKETGDFSTIGSLTSTQTVSSLAVGAGVRQMVQAGTFTGVTDGSGDLGFSFPTAFPTGLFSVMATLGDPVAVPTAKYLQPLAANKSRFGFGVRVYNSAGTGLAATNVRIDYVAVGW